jgi:hypothetical protein
MLDATRILPDLYNDCAGVMPKALSEVDVDKVQIVEPKMMAKSSPVS